MRQAQGAGQAAAGGRAAQLVHADAGGSKVWALIASAGCDIRVNSRAVQAGIRTLSDRDEIRIGGEIRYFSAETLASVEPFPGVGRPMFCARCRLEIKTGTPAVCCPSCGIWHHEGESADDRCWSYAETCTLCPQCTAHDAGFAWTPEED